jgi:hypothetical protein
MAEIAPQGAAPSLSSRIASALEFIVKVIVIGVPVLYALGRIYSDSYWQELHLPSSLMHNTTEDYLYAGFSSLVQGLVGLIGITPYTSMGYAALISLLIALLTVTALVIDRSLGPRIRGQLLRLELHFNELKQSKHREAIRHIAIGAVVWSGLLSVLSMLMVAVLVLFLPIVFAVNAGKQQAHNDLNRLTQPKSKPGRAAPPVILAHYKSDAGQITAPLLDCSDTWCVVLQEGSFAAIPRSEVSLVDHQSSTPPAH